MESIAIAQSVGRSLSDLIELEAAELEKVAAWCAQRCTGAARDEQRKRKICSACGCCGCVWIDVWWWAAVPERYHKFVDGVITFLLEAVRSQITTDQLRYVCSLSLIHI